MLTRIHS